MKKIILISAVAAAFLFTGCDSKAPQEDVKAPQQEIQKQQPTAPQTQQETQVHEPKKEVVADTIIDESEAPIEKRAQDVVEKVQESLTEVVEKAEKEVTQRSGKELFVSCIACHGADGSRPALNASQPIKGWEVEKTVNALQGYKEGTYGGALKASMIGQVANLSDADIQALAEYINSL